MKRLTTIACLFALTAFAACGVDPDASAECTVGEVETCSCGDQPASFAICDPDTEAFGECECPPPPSNGMPVTVGALMWQTNLGPSLPPAPAVTFCEEDTEAGYSDWRLPSKAEFETLLGSCAPLQNGFIVCDDGCNSPELCSAAPATWYRTSTPAGPGKHYAVHVGNGFIMPIDDVYSVSTLCVRSAS